MDGQTSNSGSIANEFLNLSEAVIPNLPTSLHKALVKPSSIQNDFKLSNHGLVLESFDKFYKSRNE